MTRELIFLGFWLGTRDLLRTYRGSILGPWWATLGLAAQISVITLIFSFALNSDWRLYVAYVTLGMVMWNFLSTTLNDSCFAFSGSAHMLRQMYVPSYLIVLRVFSKHLLAMAHNIVLVITAFALRGSTLPLSNVGAGLLGLTTFVLFVFFSAVVVSILSARFKDMPPIVSSVMMLAFYATPVFWYRDQIPSDLVLKVLAINPISHYFSVTRDPLLGTGTDLVSYVPVLTALAVCAAFAHVVVRRFGRQSVFWV